MLYRPSYSATAFIPHSLFEFVRLPGILQASLCTANQQVLVLSTWGFFSGPGQRVRALVRSNSNFNFILKSRFLVSRADSDGCGKYFFFVNTDLKSWRHQIHFQEWMCQGFSVKPNSICFASWWGWRLLWPLSRNSTVKCWPELDPINCPLSHAKISYKIHDLHGKSQTNDLKCRRSTLKIIS